MREPGWTGCQFGQPMAKLSSRSSSRQKQLKTSAPSGRIRRPGFVGAGAQNHSHDSLKGPRTNAGTNTCHTGPRVRASRPEDRLRPVRMADMDPGLRGCNPIPRIQFCTLPSSFPRKREPRDFSHLPLGPRFRGDDEVVCPWDFPTASFAGKTIREKPKRFFIDCVKAEQARQFLRRPPSLPRTISRARNSPRSISISHIG